MNITAISFGFPSGNLFQDPIGSYMNLQDPVQEFNPTQNPKQDPI